MSSWQYLIAIFLSKKLEYKWKSADFRGIVFNLTDIRLGQKPFPARFMKDF